MKPQQLSNEASALFQVLHAHLKCARVSLPTLTAIAIAIASSVVLTLSGCAEGAGIALVSQPIAPASAGAGAKPVAPTVAAE